MQEQHSQMFHQIYSRDVNIGSAMPLQIEQTPIIHPLIQFNSRNRLNFLPFPSTSRMLSQKEPQSPRPTSTRHHSRSLESGRDNTRWRGFYGSFRTFRPNNTTGEQNIWIPYICKYTIKFSGRRWVPVGTTGNLPHTHNVGEGSHTETSNKSIDKDGGLVVSIIGLEPHNCATNQGSHRH